MVKAVVGTRLIKCIAWHVQRKLEAEERQRLIDAGKALKEALAAAEVRLSQVSGISPACMTGNVSLLD